MNADSATMIGANGKLASNNLFTYALNNPTMLTDPNGYDAIVLAKTAGIPPHMGALIQDEDGNWWHFYWGVSGFWYCIGTFFGAPVPVTTWCQPYEGELSLEAINDSKQYESYDSIEYLTGDFSESLQYAQAPGEYYHLYSDNCMHKTLKILAVSNNNHSKTLLDASERMTISGAFEHIEESLTGHNFANSIVNTAIESSNSNNRKTSSICKNNNNRLALIK